MNGGAYGSDMEQVLCEAEIVERSGAIRTLSNSDIGFAYRSSIFNSAQRDCYIVLQVTYRLTHNGAPRIEYPDLKKQFAGFSGTPSLQEVRDAVRAIRQSKAMLIVEGDDDCRSAGSFFKNPVIGLPEANRIEALALELAPKETLPRYPAENGLVKLSAAWLMEHAGIHRDYGKRAWGGANS